MNGSKPQDGSWSEEDVEAALRDFFRAEMPAEFREPSPRPALRSGVAMANSHRTSRRTGRFSLAITAGVLCVAVSLVLTSSPSVPHPPRSVPVVNVAPVAGVASPSSALAKESQPVDDAMLNGRRSWHGFVIPVELRKFAPGLLTELGHWQPEEDPRGSLPPEVLVPGFSADDDDDDEEGMPKLPKRPKAEKKN